MCSLSAVEISSCRKLFFTEVGDSSKSLCIALYQIAAKGDIREFERLYDLDHARLRVQDLKGLGVLHHAAAKGKMVVMDFVLGHGGGRSLLIPGLLSQT